MNLIRRPKGSATTQRPGIAYGDCRGRPGEHKATGWLGCSPPAGCCMLDGNFGGGRDDLTGRGRPDRRSYERRGQPSDRGAVRFSHRVRSPAPHSSPSGGLSRTSRGRYLVTNGGRQGPEVHAEPTPRAVHPVHDPRRRTSDGRRRGHRRPGAKGPHTRGRVGDPRHGHGDERDGNANGPVSQAAPNGATRPGRTGSPSPSRLDRSSYQLLGGAMGFVRVTLLTTARPYRFRWRYPCTACCPAAGRTLPWGCPPGRCCPSRAGLRARFHPEVPGRAPRPGTFRCR